MFGANFALHTETEYPPAGQGNSSTPSPDSIGNNSIGEDGDLQQGGLAAPVLAGRDASRGMMGTASNGSAPSGDPSHPPRVYPGGPMDPPRARQFRRPLPQPRPFEGRQEESLVKFFRTYERYAASAWSEETQDWVAGLENFLVSWPLTLYRGLVAQGKNYEEIKGSLHQAFPGVNDPLRTKHLLGLLNLKREEGEPLSVVLQRTDNLIGSTYPALDQVSREVMCRDTFLLKLEAPVSEKIANYCSTRDDFSFEMVRHAAAVVDVPDHLRERSETVLLARSDPPAATKPQGTLSVKSETRCYLCGTSWHPVSTCPLYPVVFTCPLCRQAPHPVNECRLYPQLVRLREQDDQRRWTEESPYDPRARPRSAAWSSYRYDRNSGPAYSHEEDYYYRAYQGWPSWQAEARNRGYQGEGRSRRGSQERAQYLEQREARPRSRYQGRPNMPSVHNQGN